MEYTHLGRSGLVVSRLCLGTMNFGTYADEAQSFAIMDRALELGINFFDTANAYGRSVHTGYTEEIIGRWLAQGSERRERVVLATKVYAQVAEWPNEGKLSARHIRAACDASLRRLQTDHVDLYQMHHIDRDTPWAEIWQAMEQLFHAGKLIYNGSSNFAGWHIAQAQEMAEKRQYMGLVSEQSLYNLISRTIELEVIPACETYGLGIIPWSPLAGGLLGGVLQKHSEGRRMSDRIAQQVEQYHQQLEGYEALCREINAPPAVVGLAWLLHQPGVTAPIIGPRTVEQLNDAQHALTLELTPEVLQRLDALFPGPGGTAPEAYAW
jgi:aryl-alcohol dehydrogenase-like predicted oxidoreductase